MILNCCAKLCGQAGGKPEDKTPGKWGKVGVFLVVPKERELYTKLSTVFSTLIAENYPRIHRPYYYNNLY